MADRKVFLASSTSSPAESQWQVCASREEALKAACSLALVAHQTVLKIEGPNGELLEQPYIQNWCAEHRRQT
jgi:hypothetical protein